MVATWVGAPWIVGDPGILPALAILAGGLAAFELRERRRTRATHVGHLLVFRSKRLIDHRRTRAPRFRALIDREQLPVTTHTALTLQRQDVLHGLFDLGGHSIRFFVGINISTCNSPMVV